MDRIKVGVSSCLLGNKIRYDGKDSLNKYIVNELGRYFCYLEICPEIECGLKVPREPMNLVGNFKNPKLITSKKHIDHTSKMTNWIKIKLKELKKEQLSGFIFKSKSPSSGVSGVRVYDYDGRLKGKTSGLFAKAFIKSFPNIPYEEDHRLNNQEIRKNFITRVINFQKHN